MKSIKLFVDGHVFDGEFQGTRTYLKEIYSKILEIDPTIIIYFGVNDVENIKNTFSHFDNARFIEYESNSSIKRIFFEIPNIIDQLNCTHAHFQYVIPFKKNKNCQYIVTIHDILFNDFPDEFSLFYRLQRNFLFYLSARRCDYLLTVSGYSKQQISRQYKIDSNSIIITPNGVSDEFFDYQFSKAESKQFIKDKYVVEKYIAYISRIEPRKNQVLLLDVYLQEKLWQKGYSLVFIGSNSLKTEFCNKLSSLEPMVSENVKWIEQVDFADLKHFLNGAEVFVYPSKAEGFGIPPLEAAAMQTPVLCSSVTAMREFDFFKPYTFDPDNSVDFKEKLIDMLEHLSSIDVTTIQEIVRQKYSWEKSAQILINNLRVP
jgi:glycosyltransferase involved in cell wall biosynthesis